MPTMFRASATLAAGALAIVTGCGRDEPAGPSTQAIDAVWKQTPEGARGAIVLSPRAVKMLEAGWADVRTYITKAGPELASIASQLDVMLEPIGGSKVMLADLGMAPTKGAALFFVKDGMIAILPVVNRDLFLQKVKGTKAATPTAADMIETVACKQLGEHYACATAEPLLATLGKGDLKSKLSRTNARGDIELVGNELPLGGAAPGTVAAVAQLARGAATVRGVILNAPLDFANKLGPSQKPRSLPGKSAAFGLIDLRPMVANAPAEPIVDGVTFADLVKTLAGPLSIVVPAGEQTMDMQLPLGDPAAFQKIVDQCGELPPLVALGATSANGVCHVKIPEAGLELDAWVENKLLRVGKKGAPLSGKPVMLSPLGNELANGAWGLAFWGRGTMLAPGNKQPPPDVSGIDPAALAPVRVLSLINEAGFGVKRDGDALRFAMTVRTLFANPDDVVAKLTEISALDILTNQASAKAQPIATAKASAPFATDFTAGQTGLLVPTTLIGFGASVLIPMVMRYTKTEESAAAPAPGEPNPQMPTQGDGQYTKIVATLYVREAYPKWLEANPKKPCATLADLQQHMPDAGADTPEFPTNDEWGNALVVKCGKDLPAEAKGFAVVSGGADGKLGTPDDITSY